MKMTLAILVLILLLPLQGSAVTVTLQWDASIDEPYLSDYKIYWRIVGAPTWNTVLVGLAHQKVFDLQENRYEFYASSVDKRGLEGSGTPVISRFILGPIENGRLVPHKP